MTFKKFLVSKIILFFALTTLISVAMFILGSVFDRDAEYGYEILLSPMLYAGACVLPSFVTYSERELTVKQLIPRMVLEFLLTEAVVLGIAVSLSVVGTDRPAVILFLALSVLVIYLLVCLFTYLKESVESNRMNADLIRLQKLYEKE